MRWRLGNLYHGWHVLGGVRHAGDAGLNLVQARHGHWHAAGDHLTTSVADLGTVQVPGWTRKLAPYHLVPNSSWQSLPISKLVQHCRAAPPLFLTFVTSCDAWTSLCHAAGASLVQVYTCLAFDEPKAIHMQHPPCSSPLPPPLPYYSFSFPCHAAGASLVQVFTCLGYDGPRAIHMQHPPCSFPKSTPVLHSLSSPFCAAGASLVQVYTCLAYDGPKAVPDIKAGLAACLVKDGFKSVAEAVGADHHPAAAKGAAARRGGFRLFG